MSWELIETAPKDGTKFIATNWRSQEVFRCWWVSSLRDGGFWQDDHDSEQEPTHWMPLPRIERERNGT